MPRRQSDNTFQVAFKIPESWIVQADAIAARLSKIRTGMFGFRTETTRTDVLRAALENGLTELLRVNDVANADQRTSKRTKAKRAKGTSR